MPPHRRHRTRALRRATKPDLICIDDIGVQAADGNAAEGFFGRIDAACEHRSDVAASSDLHPGSFDQTMRKTIATAVVGRSLHRTHAEISCANS